MAEQYRVQLAKQDMVFSAAHFITFNGNVCERLHGHNYRVAVEILGPLDENGYVVDFIALRDALQAIVTRLDHHMLLPTQHKQILVAPQNGEVHVRFQDRRWVFPAGDCILLPVENTTAELLARFIGEELKQSLERATGTEFQGIRVAVDENQGQQGIWEVS